MRFTCGGAGGDGTIFPLRHQWRTDTTTNRFYKHRSIRVTIRLPPQTGMLCRQSHMVLAILDGLLTLSAQLPLPLSPKGLVAPGGEFWGREPFWSHLAWCWLVE